MINPQRKGEVLHQIWQLQRELEELQDSWVSRGMGLLEMTTEKSRLSAEIKTLTAEGNLLADNRALIDAVGREFHNFLRGHYPMLSGASKVTQINLEGIKPRIPSKWRFEPKVMKQVGDDGITRLIALDDFDEVDVQEFGQGHRDALSTTRVYLHAAYSESNDHIIIWRRA